MFKKNAEEIKTGSGVAIFVALYFLIPMHVVKDSACNTVSHFNGIVYLADLPHEGIEIKSNALSESDITNSTGSFELTYYGARTYKTIDLQLHYRTIDTVLHIPWPPADSLFVIRLNDTLPKLTKRIANLAIENFLDHEQRRVEATHKGKLLKQAGRKVHLADVCTPYQHYEKDVESKRNNVLFENALEKLTTQKALIQAQIPLKPMVPYHGHYLDNYELYLYECDSTVQNGVPKLYLHYALLNKNPIQFTVESLSSLSTTTVLAKVSITENIRYICTQVHFSKRKKTKNNSHPEGPAGSMRATTSGASYSSGTKTQSMQYLGVRPFQQFILQFETGQWKVTEAKN